MKTLLYFLIAGFIFVSSCKYDHEITEPCALHPNDKLSAILVGDWNMERATDNPAVLISPNENKLWGVAEIRDLNLKSDGQFEWGEENGIWKTDEKAQTLLLDFSDSNQSSRTFNIFGFNRCYFAYQDTAFFPGYFKAIKY